MTEEAPGEFSQRWPQILPGGKAVILTSHGANIDVISRPDHRRKTLVRGGIFGRYVATSKGTGHLLYLINGTLFAVAFVPHALEVHGTPARPHRCWPNRAAMNDDVPIIRSTLD